MKKTVRILLADDHKIIREGLRHLLEKQPDFKVIDEAGDGRETVKKAKALRPDVVIMDIGMPHLNGIDATRQVLATSPGSRVIALSMHSHRRLVAEMLKAGASAYLLKDSASEELGHGSRAALAEKIYLSPDIAETVVREYLTHIPAKDFSAFSILTQREREVLQLIAEGKTTKEIASLLYLSVKTVETHRQNIMDKLELHSVAELTKYAVREGLTSLDD
ncbi:MAG: response regulator [Candidatus Aminicenantales bacterium]